MNKPYSGLTLIELVMVIAMLSILLGVAIPSYREYVLRANRIEATETLLKIAACQERVYTLFKRYDTGRCDISAISADSKYVITMSTSNVNQKFTLTAVAQSDQGRDPCGDLTLTDQGVKGSSATNDPARVADCWRD